MCMLAVTQSYGLSPYISFPAALPLLRARNRLAMGSSEDGIAQTFFLFIINFCL